MIFSIVWAAAILLFIPGSEKACGIFLGMGFVLVMYKVVLPAVASPFAESVQTLIISGFTFFTVTALWPAIVILFSN